MCPSAGTTLLGSGYLRIGHLPSHSPSRDVQGLDSNVPVFAPVKQVTLYCAERLGLCSSLPVSICHHCRVVTEGHHSVIQEVALIIAEGSCYRYHL